MRTRTHAGSGPEQRRDLLELTIGIARRLAWTWVVLLTVVELAILPALIHRPTPLGVDLAAVVVTAVFGVSVIFLPSAALRWLDRAEQQRTASAAQTSVRGVAR